MVDSDKVVGTALVKQTYLRKYLLKNEITFEQIVQSVSLLQDRKNRAESLLDSLINQPDGLAVADKKSPSNQT